MLSNTYYLSFISFISSDFPRNFQVFPQNFAECCQEHFIDFFFFQKLRFSIEKTTDGQGTFFLETNISGMALSFKVKFFGLIRIKSNSFGPPRRSQKFCREERNFWENDGWQKWKTNNRFRCKTTLPLTTISFCPYDVSLSQGFQKLLKSQKNV